LAEIKSACSTGCTANGPVSWGACGSNEVAAKWMVAQIAQYPSASLMGSGCGSEGTECVPATERRSVDCRRPPRWTWPNERTICNVSANSPRRAPIFEFALNQCITRQLVAMRFARLIDYLTTVQLRSGISTRRALEGPGVHLRCTARPSEINRYRPLR
jgi:hypothetical protein